MANTVFKASHDEIKKRNVRTAGTSQMPLNYVNGEGIGHQIEANS